ncbi:hypothetical protein M514_06263 [Trichuris suis]|uniref:Uncharacterized protein n=1 Tax=Trichuris suis TaxID=68888 RepID=A0A085NEW0_9BILA|nr:hypothetical protein M513_06263 [Trichuris suis]KFD68006.1 hypothetical protein M514_06263 [Trichuris suis]
MLMLKLTLTLHRRSSSPYSLTTEKGACRKLRYDTRRGRWKADGSAEPWFFDLIQFTITLRQNANGLGKKRYRGRFSGSGFPSDPVDPTSKSSQPNGSCDICGRPPARIR